MGKLETNVTRFNRIAAGGMKVPLFFTQVGVAASQNAVALKLIDTAWDAGTTDASFDAPANTEVVMPLSGSIIGVSVASTAARTAGTLTVEVTKNGSGTGLQAQLNATDTQYAYATQELDEDTFDAGDRIGVKITTSADWAPTTADIVVMVLVAI